MFTTSRGYRIRYQVFGDGPPLMLLHGLRCGATGGPTTAILMRSKASSGLSCPITSAMARATSRTILVDSGANVSPQPTIGYVSCASATFCAAVDAGGNALTFNGKTWSTPDTIDAGTIWPLDAVSCPTVTFCTAVDGWGQAFTFNGSTWSGPAGLESSGDLQAISCTTAHFCAVVDLSGNVLTFNGASWAGPTYIDPDVSTGYGFTGVSCPDAASCMAVDWEGNAITGSG
jgi:hypothetical protein